MTKQQMYIPHYYIIWLHPTATNHIQRKQREYILWSHLFSVQLELNTHVLSVPKQHNTTVTIVSTNKDLKCFVLFSWQDRKLKAVSDSWMLRTAVLFGCCRRHKFGLCETLNIYCINKHLARSKNMHVPLPSMHQIKRLIDLGKGQRVSDKLIHHQLLAHVVIHQFRNAFHTLPTWKTRAKHCKQCTVYIRSNLHIVALNDFLISNRT